jgi:hypothetical protein
MRQQANRAGIQREDLRHLWPQAMAASNGRTCQCRRRYDVHSIVDSESQNTLLQKERLSILFDTFVWRKVPEVRIIHDLELVLLLYCSITTQTMMYFRHACMKIWQCLCCEAMPERWDKKQIVQEYRERILYICGHKQWLQALAEHANVVDDTMFTVKLTVKVRTLCYRRNTYQYSLIHSSAV